MDHDRTTKSTPGSGVATRGRARYNRRLVWADLFTSDFAQAIWANLVASGAVAVGFYFAIDRRLRRAERMEQRNELVRDVLREVQRELDYDHDQAEVLLEHAPKGELPFPLFDVNGWTMLMQADVLSALDAKTLELLVMTYNRLRTSNEQWRLASDMLNGPTAVLAQGFTTIAGGTSEAFDLRRATVFNSLAERVTELLLVLDEARERVSTQLAEIEKSRPRKGSWQAVRRSELGGELKRGDDGA
jgi:hypothetical protein